MIRTEEEHLAHYGILRRSGRYPWGSGKYENTRNRSFLDTIEMHKKEGMTDTQIARGYGITTTQLRAAKTIALAQQKQERILATQRLKEKGWSNSAIARRQNRNESSVRADLAPGAADKADALFSTADMLKRQVNEKEYIDIGSAVHLERGVTRTHFDTSVAILKEQGYETHTIYIPQAATGKYTTMKVLAKPGTTLAEVNANRGKIRQIDEYSDDYGRTFEKPQPPLSISSRRIAVKYGDKGGAEADGVIYVRPGVDDLRIGSKNYAQVRIAVDGTHYLKGMAVYKDDLPDGVDLMFNTNKMDTGRKKDVMKDLADDPDFPFGAVVYQIKGKDGKVNSAMNLVYEEGQWDKWSRTLSSQMLSKQSPELAKQQLDLTFERRKREYDEIMSLTNPTVRKDLLLKFADSTDSAAVHLKAANLPRQSTKVLLPIRSINPKEVYAPNMKNGEQVALIRFPHGGTFEIPVLTVNNRNREARRILGTSAADAIGIHHTVARHLSGADFDGDTVLVIPKKGKQLSIDPPLEDLKNFDPMTYKVPAGSPIPRITSRQKGQQMGKVSNLITDMTIRGASSDEIARAVRHSMVVIDAEKHHLDIAQSEKDNGIRSLKEKYQGKTTAGARTIISRKKAEVYVPQTKPRPRSMGGPIDPVTGRKVYVPTGRMIPERKRTVDPVTGEVKYVTTGVMKEKRQKSTKLAEVVTKGEDAFTLSSGTKMEGLYAEHSNKLTALANAARKDAIVIKAKPKSSSAEKVYAKEVDSLNHKLNVALKNTPRERQAQNLTSATLAQKRQANPHMEEAEVKKIKQQLLNQYRTRTGAKKDKIKITQAEWNAIQAGALAPSTLEKILYNANMDTVRVLALPKTAPKMTSTKRVRAQSMLKLGYTQAEIAEALGVGLTTLKVSFNE